MGTLKTKLYSLVLTSLLFLPFTVNAASVSFYLDQTNLDPLSGTSLVDGTNFLMVTIDDEGTAGDINLTVQTLSPLSDLAGNNFGIQSFAFNTLIDPGFYDENSSFAGIPSNWSTNVIPPTNQEDGFGRFDISMSDGGTQRVEALNFSISGIVGDTIADYLELSLNGGGSTPPQGSVYFTAHIAGFDDGNGNTSAFFGGMTPVPVPAAFILLLSALGGLTFFKSRKP